MNVALVEKSKTGMKLNFFDGDLSLLESETFPDLYTLNFHLQTLAKKHKVVSGLLVVHDHEKNRVNLTLAKDEDSFFVD